MKLGHSAKFLGIVPPSHPQINGWAHESAVSEREADGASDARDQRDVVRLLGSAESLHASLDRRQKVRGGQVSVFLDSFSKPLFAVLFVSQVRRLGDSVCANDQKTAGLKLHF
jgi:hypothetical protein